MDKKSDAWLGRCVAACFVLLSFVQNSDGQSVARQSISSYGTQGSRAGHSFAQTVGQPYATHGKQSKVVLQGFQQSTGLKVERLAPPQAEELQLDVYPNPAKYLINIRCKREVEATVIVRNMQGKKLYEQQIKGLKHQINCNAWSPGIYFISVQDTSNRQSTRKLIISN